jgi:hypothetical protein
MHSLAMWSDAILRTGVIALIGDYDFKKKPDCDNSETCARSRLDKVVA